MSKATETAGLGKDPEAARPANSVLKEATAECSRKQEALDRAARSVEHAKLQLEKANAAFEKATDEMVEAECARLLAQERVSKPPDKTPDGITFAVDPSLFESLDELEDADRAALETFQKQLEYISKQATAKQKEFQALLDQAKNAHREAATKRRRRNEDGGAVRGEGGAGGLPAAQPPPGGAAPTSPSQAPSSSAVFSEEVRRDMRVKFAANSEAQAKEAKGLGKGGGASADGSLTILFGNIAEWGPQAARFLSRESERSVVGFCETHKGEFDMPDICAGLDKDGWRLAHTAARPSGKSESGPSGGEWILTKKHIAATSFESARRASANAGRLAPCRGFAPIALRTKAGNLVFISACLLPGLGVKGWNNGALVALGAFVRSLADPYLIMADWIIEPGPFRSRRWYRHLALPLPLPPCERPRALPDPESKTAKKKEAARQRRRQELPSEFHDAFEELHPPAELPVEKAALHVPGEIWEEAEAQARWEGVHALHNCDPSEVSGRHAPFDRAHHYTFEWQAAGRTSLDEQHAHWITVMERAVLLHEKVDSDKWYKYSGRAGGPSCCWKLVRATPGRAHVRNEQTEWWGQTSTVVIRYVVLRNNAPDPHQAAQRADCARKLIEQLDGVDDVIYFGKQQDPLEIFAWKGMVANLDLAPVQPLPEVLERIRRWTDLSNERAMMAPRSQFMRWAQDMWATKPGAFHRHVKPAAAPVWESKDPSGTVTSDCQEMLQGLAAEWTAMWTDPVDQPKQMCDMMRKCLDAARVDPLPAITLLDLDMALPRIPAGKTK
ncbi:unnamed protein product, partial [Prorocentrum cordatum]